MKNDFVIEEIKSALKRLEKKNNTKTLLVLAIGIVLAVLGIIYIVMKIRDRFIWGDADDYYDDFDEFDYEDYADDMDESDIEDDLNALDFEEEE